MKTKKSAQSLGAEGAEKKFDNTYFNTPLIPGCQVLMPIFWLIRSDFIKILVFQRYADVLLVFAVFLEGRCRYGLG